MNNSSPIAVMDTGVGGLSVVKALREALPDEDIHYFADTAHLPYGIKSPDLIHHLSLKMATKLVELSSCKLLVIACHTISVWCLKEIQSALNIPVIGMIEPSIAGLIPLHRNSPFSLGVLSTKATVLSGAYKNALPIIDPSGEIALYEHPCGPLVSLIEETDINDDDFTVILNNFLPNSIKQCDALLIGCTHFSALKPSLKRVLKPNCRLIDAADFTANAVLRSLNGSKKTVKSSAALPLTVYVSDNQERFLEIAKRFIDEEFSISLVQDYVRS